MSDLNPIVIADALAAGARRWTMQHEEPPEMRDKIWCLLEEAAETMRTLPSGRPMAFSSAWPEFVLSLSEIGGFENMSYEERRNAMREERSVDKDLYTRGSKMRAGASAGALMRFIEVTDWLRFIPAKTNKALRMRLMLALAGGLSPTRASRSDEFAALQIGTRWGVTNFRDRSLDAIAARIKPIVKDVTAGTAAA